MDTSLHKATILFDCLKILWLVLAAGSFTGVQIIGKNSTFLQ
jgi:hypothetical protein